MAGWRGPGACSSCVPAAAPGGRTATCRPASGLAQDHEVVPAQAGQAVLAQTAVPHRVGRGLLLGLQGGLTAGVVAEVAAVALECAGDDQSGGGQAALGEI